MPVSDAGLNIMADAWAAAATHMSLHTADPGATGASESTAARQPCTFSAATGSGDLSVSAAENFTGGAASGACTHVGFWTASTAGTWLGGFALTGDQTFNAAGEYTVTDFDLNGSSS